MKKCGRSAVALSILVEMTKSKLPTDLSVSRNSFSTPRPRGRVGARRLRQSGPPKIGAKDAIVSSSSLYEKRFTNSYMKLTRTSHFGRIKRGLILLRG